MLKMNTLPAHEAVSQGIVDEGVRVAVVLDALVYGDESSHKAHPSLILTLVTVLYRRIHKVDLLDHIVVEALFIYFSTFIVAVVKPLIDTLDDSLVAIDIELYCVQVFGVLNKSWVTGVSQQTAYTNFKQKD